MTPHALSGRHFAFMVAALTASQAAGTMMTVAMPSVAPAVAEGYGVPVYMIGYQVSILYLGVIFGLTVGANLSARWGACRTIQAGLVLEALGMLLATTKSFAALVSGSLIMGFGYALLTPASSQLLLRYTPEHRRNMIFSLKQTGVPLGSVLAAATGPSLTLAIGWQKTMWLFVAVVCAVIAVMQWRRERWDYDRNPEVPLAANPFGALGLMWRNPMIRVLSLTAAMLSCSQITIQNFTVAMFYEQLGMPLVQAGLILGAAQIGGMAGRLFWGWMADRTRDCIFVLSMVSGILLVVSLFCATLELGWPFAAIAALFFVFGATASGWHGAFLSEIARIAPAGKVSTATGSALLLGNVSATTTPLLFAGVYAAIHNYAYTFALLAIPSLVSLLLLRSARKLSRRTATR